MKNETNKVNPRVLVSVNGFSRGNEHTYQVDRVVKKFDLGFKLSSMFPNHRFFGKGYDILGETRDKDVREITISPRFGELFPFLIYRILDNNQPMCDTVLGKRQAEELAFNIAYRHAIVKAQREHLPIQNVDTPHGSYTDLRFYNLGERTR